MPSRTVNRQYPAYRDDIGDLITRRPVPGPAIDQVDPFLFLNHHGPQDYRPDNQGLPFGPHPHRGFETVTFILAGELAHRDSGGHESVIGAGGVQWMTAGSGLIHAELSPESFKRRGGPLEILQLWVNLPARLKMTQPAYVGMQREQIPAIAADDGRATVNLVSGHFDGRNGPIESLTDVTMMTVTLSTGSRVSLPAPAGRAVFLYVVAGELDVNGTPVEPWHLVEMNDDGDDVALVARSEAVVLFGHAEPLREPVVSHGPFVMNTHEEIRQAVEDYQSGRLGAVTL
ncbi:pirin family protein [Halomonas sp. McH1-25]|uniref:pirin family protein n=1 Tax=unclassified Halomonas TaxID=2609666 RepID=UPI001EF672BE|nr:MULTISPECIES: pirin family protein [unclassified Halomonas]MCG7600763.1 pirin family protein [Halomonas sp. McH1-25]MCP1342728.1 pirin family protein [Halomonas sp. FL8]MCP1361033.1 pirin family protein [Halomonas sp. BBD45]